MINCRREALRWAVLLLLLLQAGCETQGHRARQYSAEFGGWPEEVQQRVLSGVVHEGDNRTMVYIALGAPLRVLSSGDWERWEYLGWLDGEGEESMIRTTNDMDWLIPWRQRETIVWLVDFREGAVVSSKLDDRMDRPPLRQELGPMRMPDSPVN